MVIIDSYMKELELDCLVDQLNIFDKQRHQANLELKWIYKYHQHKDVVKNLKDELDDYMRAETKKEDQAMKLSSPKIKFKINNLPRTIELRKAIEREEDIVSFLDKVLGTLSRMSYSFKNMVDLIKREYGSMG